MKITDEISTLIPDGWEINPNSRVMIVSDGDDDKVIKLFIKRKKEKNFEYYVLKYLGNHHWYKGSVTALLSEFNRGSYNIDFEIKIGLLKYICDDIGNGFSLQEYYSNNNPDVYHTEYDKLNKICPKGFLNSIF